MKRKIISVFVYMIIIFLFTLPSYAEYLYTDPLTHTTFKIPDNWVEVPLLNQETNIDVKFKSNENDKMLIMFSSFDLWEEFSKKEKLGLNREDIDNSILSKADVAEMFGTAISKVKTVTYNKKKYYQVEVSEKVSQGNYNIFVYISHLIHVENGYIYTFSFNGSNDNELYIDFITLLNSINYPSSNSKISTSSTDIPNDSGYNNDYILRELIPNLIFSFIFTIFIYSLPIIIYRYMIRKSPVPKKSAIGITIIYGIVASIIMSGLLYIIDGTGPKGTAILIWSYINYLMLKGGKDSTTNNKQSKNLRKDIIEPDITYFRDSEGKDNIYNFDENNEETIEEEPKVEDNIEEEPKEDLKDYRENLNNTKQDISYFEDSDMRFCYKCGNKLHPNASFCSMCGVKIPTSNTKD